MDYSQSAWWTCHSLKGWDIEDSCFDNMQRIQCLVNKNVMKDFLWKIMKFSGLYFEQQWTCTASGYPHIAFWGHPICPEIIWFGSSSDQANQDLVGWPLTFVWPLSSTTMDLHGLCVFLITQSGQGAPIQHPGGIQFGPNLPVVGRDKFFKRKSRHSWTTFTLFSGLCLQQEWTLLVLCVSLIIQMGLGTPYSILGAHNLAKICLIEVVNNVQEEIKTFGWPFLSFIFNVNGVTCMFVCTAWPEGSRYPMIQNFLWISSNF